MTKTMHILISNDDGYQAPGIRCLAEVLGQIARVTIVAPDRDRSGASNSLTLDRPLRVDRLEENIHYLNGTPTDCVHLATTGLLEEAPDMVVSGINNGYNLGDDVLYSGTVSAAIEGRYLGLPGIAVSLERPCDHYMTAAQITRDLVLRLQTHPLPRDTVLNVNVPDLPPEEIKGIEVTSFGKRHPAKPAIPLEDPRGHELYWIGLPGNAQEEGPGTDFYAVSSGKVSVTPFRLDWTNYEIFEQLANWVAK